MAANLTPQYLEAESEFKKAKTSEERLDCLKRMYSLLPKHKASEKLQADLKTRMSELRQEIDRERKAPKRTASGHKIPKQGAGQYIILGAPMWEKAACSAGSRARCRKSRPIPSPHTSPMPE